jgi:cation diffusion facilitator family transporter
MLKNLAERAAILSLIITAAFGTIEVTVALSFSMIAFLAAGIDTLADSLTSLFVFVGLRVSKRPADRGHKYGHWQAETLVLLVLAVALVIAALRIGLLSLDKIYSRTQVETSPALFLLAVIAVGVFSWLGWYQINVGKKTNSPSLEADGYHTLTDAFSATAVLVGLFLVQAGYVWADPIVALIISVIILWWGLKFGHQAINVLMGASPGENTMKTIRESCRNVPGVKGCHKCRARRVGSRIHADLHIQVDPKLSVKESHNVASKVERSLKAKMPDLASVVVHIEPAGGRKSGKKRQ